MTRFPRNGSLLRPLRWVAWLVLMSVAATATMAQQWDHRPDLDFSPASEACDPKEAARYRESLPKEVGRLSAVDARSAPAAETRAANL
jgi:hypothetical protein